MIDFIEGEIISKEPQKVVLKTGGIGFGIKASNQTMASLPPPGSTVMVFTNLQMREDDISLYGFFSKEERSFFELLIQVSGVGPKLALTILSAYPVLTLKKALVTGDLTTLSGISGIGKKTAQRMVLELKDKLDKEMIFDDGAGGLGRAVFGVTGDKATQAIEALEALGYTRNEILKALAGAELSNSETEDIIRLGLRQLARF